MTEESATAFVCARRTSLSAQLVRVWVCAEAHSTVPSVTGVHIALVEPAEQKKANVCSATRKHVTAHAHCQRVYMHVWVLSCVLDGVHHELVIQLNLQLNHCWTCTHAEPNQARVNVPDERFKWLVDVYKPKVSSCSRCGHEVWRRVSTADRVLGQEMSQALVWRTGTDQPPCGNEWVPQLACHRYPPHFIWSSYITRVAHVAMYTSARISARISLACAMAAAERCECVPGDLGHCRPGEGRLQG